MTFTTLLVATTVALVLLAGCALSLRRWPCAGWNLALITVTGLALLDVVWVALLLVLGDDVASTLTLVLVTAALAALAVGLVVNGVIMLRKEGRTLANLLSLLLAAGLVGMGVLLWVALHWNITWLAGVCGPLLVVTAYVVITLIGFVVYSTIATWLKPRGTVNAVIVLGSGLIGATVPPLLAGRLEAGAKAWRRAHTRSGSEPLLIPSGGQGADEERPEGVAMAEYLRAHHPATDAFSASRTKRAPPGRTSSSPAPSCPTPRPASSWRRATTTCCSPVGSRMTWAWTPAWSAPAPPATTCPRAMLREYAATVQAGRVAHAAILGTLVVLITVSVLQQHV